MKILEEKFKKGTEHIALVEDEKKLMRERLVLYMEYKPICQEFCSKKESFHYRNLPLFSFFKTHHVSGAFLIAGIVASSTFGVSFAADDALPGDLLYGVKVNINEEIKSALISSDDTESLVAWEQERAERRLKEAGQLATEGRLDTKKQEQVTKLFAEHAETLVEHVLATEETDPVLAAEISSVIEESLGAHEAMFARIIVEQEGDLSENARNLVGKVHAATEEVEKIRESVEKKIDIASSDTVSEDGSEKDASTTNEISVDRVNSANLRERAAYRAEAQAQKLHEDLQMIHRTLEEGSDIALQSGAQITLGEQFMNEGKKALEQHDLSDAYRAYRKALSLFQNVSKTLEIAKLFSITIYPSNTFSVHDGYADDEVSHDEVEDMHHNAKQSIENARSFLLSNDGFEQRDVEWAQQRIKDVSALVLRAEVVMVLGNYADAKRLYEEVLVIAEEVTATLKDRAEDDNVREITIPPQEQEGDEISMQHRYEGGKHIFKGTIVTSTPCVSVDGEVLVEESFPEGLQIALTTTTPSSNDMSCAQVLTEKEFFLEVFASEQAIFKGIQVNGIEKKWILSAFEMGLEDVASSHREAE